MINAADHYQDKIGPWKGKGKVEFYE